MDDPVLRASGSRRGVLRAVGWKMKPYRTIKQGMNDAMCAVCAVAMATGSTPEEVYEFLNDGRIMGDPICTAEEAIFLLSRGWIRGRGYAFDAPISTMKPSHHIEHTIGEMPALLDVVSPNIEGCEHAVFFDGKVCRDPDPRVPDETELSDYKILRVWPLTRVLEIRYCKRIQLAPRHTPLFVLEAREGRYVAGGEWYS